MSSADVCLSFAPPTARATDYASEPTRGERDDDPSITKLLEDAWQAVYGEPLAPLPAQIIDSRLVLLRDGEKIGRRGFDGGEDAYAEAQDASGAQLRQHGGDSLDTFTTRAMQTSRRMAWDHDYYHRLN